jgi:hypothetical protein
MSEERRRVDRKVIRAAVVARRVTPTGHAAEGHGETVNISMGGFAARLDGDWGTGDVADAELILGSEVVRIRALVVNVSRDGDYQRVHCAFSQPAEPTRTILSDFLEAAGA